jgi:imidazolonepropionase-like amidohydrolase
MTEEKNIIAITGGRLIDGTGGDPVENASIIIEGSMIKAAGKRISIPKNAIVLDASGKTVMPGLINSHMHLAGGKSGTHPVDPSLPREIIMVKAADDARQCLPMGFTTVKDCGGRNALFLKRAEAEGLATGFPRIVAAGCLMTHTNGPMDRPPICPGSLDARRNPQAEGLICGNENDCLAAAEYSLHLGADFVKAFASFGFMETDMTSPDAVVFTTEELQAFVTVASKNNKFVTVHSQNCLSSRYSILAGVKTIDHASRLDDETVMLGKKRDAIFVSSLSFVQVTMDGGIPPRFLPKLKDEWDCSIDAYTSIHDAGAILAVGTDSFGEPSMGALEMELLIKHCKYTPMEIIVAATKHGAQACFMGGLIGTIETGKLADIIVVDGDPLTDIKVLQQKDKIKMVMLEGKIQINRGI